MNLKKKNINCYICKEKTPTKVIYKDGDIRIVRCCNCGLMYQNPQLPEEWIQKISYKPNYFEFYEKIEEKQKIFFKNRFQSTFNKLKGKRVLDIGCGTGSFLCAAEESGLEAYGVEISEWASQIARKKLRVKIFTGLLRNAGFNDNAFDMVHMSHVLEHFADPVAELLEVKRILKPNGLLFIEVPNEKNFKLRLRLLNLFRKLLVHGKRDPIKPYPEHLFLYTEKTMAIILNRAGLDILNLKIEGFSDKNRLNISIVNPNWKTYLFSLILKTGIDLKMGLGSFIIVEATKNPKLHIPVNGTLRSY